MLTSFLCVSEIYSLFCGDVRNFCYSLINLQRHSSFFLFSENFVLLQADGRNFYFSFIRNKINSVSSSLFLCSEIFSILLMAEISAYLSIRIKITTSHLLYFFEILSVFRSEMALSVC